MLRKILDVENLVLMRVDSMTTVCAHRKVQHFIAIEISPYVEEPVNYC